MQMIMTQQLTSTCNFHCPLKDLILLERLDLSCSISVCRQQTVDEEMKQSTTWTSWKKKAMDFGLGRCWAQSKRLSFEGERTSHCGAVGHPNNAAKLQLVARDGLLPSSIHSQAHTHARKKRQWTCHADEGSEEGVNR